VRLAVPQAIELPRPGRLVQRLGLRGLATVFAAALAGAFVALLAYGVMAQSPNTSIDVGLARGQAPVAPQFRLALLSRGRLGPVLGGRLADTLRGPFVSLRALRGTPVVLNFYASWCVTCRAEAPTLERAWRLLARPRGVLLLGLDMQDAPDDAYAYARQYGIDYTSVHDPSNAVARSYGVTGLPETFFIDAAGRVVGHVIGISTTAQLAAGIAAALEGRVGGTDVGGAQRPLK